MSTKKKPAVNNDFPDINKTPVITDAAALATLNDEPVVSGEFDDLPTVAEARAMFDERSDLSQVLTDEGMLNRDGLFSGPPVEKRLTLDGAWVAK
jgi:hypothetical protein